MSNALHKGKKMKKQNKQWTNAKAVAQEKKNVHDTFLFNVPFRVLEVKLFKTKSFVIPAYKVVCWGKDVEEQEPMWLCGGRLPKNDNITDEEILCDAETFIYGGFPSFYDLFKEENMENNENFLIPNDGEVEFLEWRYGTAFSQEFNDERFYVGLDVWNTSEGLKYSVSGSNFLKQKAEGGCMLLIDEISFELMFGKKIAA